MVTTGGGDANGRSTAAGAKAAHSSCSPRQLAMASGFLRLQQVSTETRLWSWLSFLNVHEILLVSDLLSRDVRQQVESDPTLWSELVAKVFPRAALACVSTPSVVPPALPGSSKELFRLLTRLLDGSTAHHNLSFCLEIVPVRVMATHQVQVVAQSRLFCLTLPGGMSFSDGVYLRERLQDLHVMHKSKAHGLAKRKARSSIKNLVVKQAKACFVLTLRGTCLVLESSLLPSSQLCTVQLRDIVEIKTASEGPYFVIDVPWERIHVRVKTPESARAWVATVKLARARCLLEATVHSKLRTMDPSTQPSPSPQRTASSSAGKARLRRFTTRLSSMGVSKLASWLPRTNSAPLAYYVTPIKPTTRAIEDSDGPRPLVPAVTPVGILPPTPQFVIHKLSRADQHRQKTPPPRSQSATASEGSRESDVKDPGDSREPTRAQRWFLPRRRRDRESSASSRSSAADSTFDPDELSADSERICALVRRLLQSNEHFEGQVCMRFLKQMDQFRSTAPSDCSSYLTKVRDCIQDLVQFVLTFRIQELRSMELQHLEKLESSVQHAVESYFCSCTHQQLTKWATAAAEIRHTRRFRHRLSRWSRLPPSSAEFGLANEHAVDQCEYMQIAIARLRRIGLESTPSSKLTALMAGVRALSASLSQKERPKHEQQLQLALPTANDLLPVFIFAVCRSKMRDPLLQCALLRGLARFESAHGEPAYYLTMLEASLEYVRRYE